MTYLQKLMWRYLSFEGFLAPDFPEQDAKSLQKLILGFVEEHEIVAKQGNVGQNLNNDIDIVIRLDIVQANEPFKHVDDLEGKVGSH